MNMADKLKNYIKSIPNRIKKLFEGLTPGRFLILLGVELFFIGLVIAADLLTKEFVYQPLKDTGRDYIIIKKVLVLTPVENTGASFGIFQDSTTALAIISMITVVIVSVLQVFTIKNRNFFLRSGLVMIIAGGIGNLVDRLTLGYVRDFVYFELIDFAVFNLADSALTVGVIFILIFILFYYMPEDKKKAKKEETP